MIGVDEVGRGAWAGPLLVCAVRLNDKVEGLRDSKKLSAKKRELLTAQIEQVADIGFGWVSAAKIDEFGLGQALRTATSNAITAVSPLPKEEIIIDGIINFAPQYDSVKPVARADDLYPVVSAASIVAKVARDAYMAELAVRMPLYSFERHKGYGTALHTTLIKEYGLGPEHRRIFKIPT